MLTNTELIPKSISHVKFISYDGKWPNLCRGTLIFEIDGERVIFGYHHLGEKFNEIDAKELPEQYRKYAEEIERVFNENVEWGCCGGCI